MKNRLDKDLRDQFATCTGVQILKVELPKQQEDKLVEVQVSEQLTQQRLFAQQAQQVNKNIEVDTSVAQAVIRDIDAKAAAEAKAVNSDAEAKIQSSLIQSKANAYQQISQITGQTAADTLTDYIYYTNMLNNKNATILVGIEDAQLGIARSQMGKGY